MGVWRGRHHLEVTQAKVMAQASAAGCFSKVNVRQSQHLGQSQASFTQPLERSAEDRRRMATEFALS